MKRIILNRKIFFLLILDIYTFLNIIAEIVDNLFVNKRFILSVY